MQIGVLRNIMEIRIGTVEDKQWILEKYPNTSQVMNEGGCLIIAVKHDEIIGFVWSFRRIIPAPINKTEDFINVIEVFAAENRCKGIASQMVKKCLEIAKENGSYQVRAYCDINNVASHMLWIKNRFTISPVKMNDGQVLGSYVTSLL